MATPEITYEMDEPAGEALGGQVAEVISLDIARVQKLADVAMNTEQRILSGYRNHYKAMGITAEEAVALFNNWSPRPITVDEFFES